MTKLDVLQMIGDLLTELDVAIGSTDPTSAEHRQLADLRLLLDDRQRDLARKIFDENTPAFAQITSDLTNINADIKRTIDDLTQIEETIQNVQRFVTSLTSLLSTIGLAA
jgi:hypothetical protein